MYDIQETLTTFYGIIFIVSLVIGLIPAYIASSKGKDFFTWYVYGVLLFFFAMIHAIVLPEKTGTAQTTAQDIKEAKVPLKDIPSPLIYKDPLLIVPNSPAELLSYEIKVPKDTDAAYASIKLLNVFSIPITAVKLRLHCYDAFNEPVGTDGNNIIAKNIQDLNAEPRSYFADDVLIDLQDLKDTRKIKVEIVGALFKDGSKWGPDGGGAIEVITDVAEGEDLELLKQLAGEDAICYAKSEKTYWQCVCGRVNTLVAEKCLRCDRIKVDALNNLGSKSIVNTILESQRLENEAEEKRQQDNLKQKRLIAAKNTRALIKKAGVPLAALLLIAVISILVYQLILKDMFAYNRAFDLMNEMAYMEAATIFEDLDDYRDSKEMLLQSNYNQAKAYFEISEYEEAADLFEALGAYRDSQEMRSLSSLAASGVGYFINNVSGTTPIGDLPIGTRVVDLSWEWEFRIGNNYYGNGAIKPVVWIVVAKDHYDGIEPHVTLLAEELIGRHSFDNSNNRGSSNHWGDSGTPNATHGLRPWLNSNGIHSDEGFYQAFSDSFKQAVLTTTVPNKVWLMNGGNEYSTLDRVFIPSTTELGDSEHERTHIIGATYRYFLVEGAIKRTALFSGNPRGYWTRSPNTYTFGGSRFEGSRVEFVCHEGEFSGRGGGLAASDGDRGVRPVLNLKSETLVSEIKN